ncbi:MAG: hypothetical protein ACYDDA_00435 [Acidiferrobacteraceae bacterium]
MDYTYMGNVYTKHQLVSSTGGDTWIIVAQHLMFQCVPGMKAMLALQIGDLELLRKTASKLTLTLVPTQYRKAWWYQLEIHIEGAPEPGLLFSARKNPRRWKTLNKAVAFVEQTLPGVRHVGVTTRPGLKKRKTR